MNDEIQSLLDSIRRGQYEDPTEKIALLAAALQEGKADEALLASLLRAPQVPLRLAGLEACRLRKLQVLEPALVMLADDPESRVRLKLLECLDAVSRRAAEGVLLKLIDDDEPEVRTQAVKASAGRHALMQLQSRLLLNDPSWAVRQAAATALGSHPKLQGGADLLRALAQDADSDVGSECAKQLDRQLMSDGSAAAEQLPTDVELLYKAEATVVQLGGRYNHLLNWLRAHGDCDQSTGTAKYGTDLTALAEAKTLPRAHHVESMLATLIDLLGRQRRRSIALIGRAGAGKTALVNELVYALARPENGGWRVLRVSPADLMSGTKYLGEWETKVKELVAAIKRPRRVLLYVTSLGDLSSAGRSSQSDFNIAAALAPHLDDGSVVLLGESAPEEFERGLGREASLVRLFDKVLVEESSAEQTVAVLRGIRDEARAAVPDERLSEIVELSGFFLGHLARPGGAATLLRAVLAWVQETGHKVTRLDILKILSQSSGLPVQLLDDGTALDQSELRGFFEKQIIGQPEAIDAVVDVVTLIKAGLTDPNRPFNVMLFVGPTGVGKTELARSLAEYIFGDPSRLLRFDMSEFAGPEGFARLIGSREEAGLLTDAVRQRPFSVLLLDEIEKSHINVFDLCLQIFDAGRLTDGRGRLVDFRRTVVILTSNVGAEGPGSRLGFVTPGTGSTPAVADPDRTMRELSRVFRPEFLNRIDRIVACRALARSRNESPVANWSWSCVAAGWPAAVSRWTRIRR
ncbi:MAG: AAA family ATPase [Verrucomicrobia bacterium]|nr:AAA family ATPase [Verrucomicrobiota bacterium]